MNCVFRDQKMIRRHDWASALALESRVGIAKPVIPGVTTGHSGVAGYPVVTSTPHKFIRVEVSK